MCSFENAALMIKKPLLHWYKANKRDLPWRLTSDPYQVWLSEIILQQTRVAQGLPYYNQFIRNFPTVFDLAKAPEQKVLKLWQGLGYYSRARNLHQTAKDLVKHYKGVFPEDVEELKKLKGIGDYTAAAIASFCFNKAHAVVDGNVFRVLSRLFAISTPINSPLGKKQFSELAQELLDKKNPGLYNQAIMEFGALYCTPHQPDCENCIFNTSCQAGLSGNQHLFPSKLASKKARNRYFEYFIIWNNLSVYAEKRTGKDIWKNLYQFPLLEFAEKPSKPLFLTRLKKDILKSNSHDFKIIRQSGYKKHLLSHQTIFARFTHLQSVKLKR